MRHLCLTARTRRVWCEKLLCAKCDDRICEDCKDMEWEDDMDVEQYGDENGQQYDDDDYDRYSDYTPSCEFKDYDEEIPPLAERFPSLAASGGICRLPDGTLYLRGLASAVGCLGVFNGEGVRVDNELEVIGGERIGDGEAEMGCSVGDRGDCATARADCTV